MGEYVQDVHGVCIESQCLASLLVAWNTEGSSILVRDVVVQPFDELEIVRKPLFVQLVDLELEVDVCLQPITELLEDLAHDVVVD